MNSIDLSIHKKLFNKVFMSMAKQQTTPNSPIVKPIGDLKVNPNIKTPTSSPILEKFRQPKLLLDVGAKGQGKTHETLEVVEEYWRGNPQHCLKDLSYLLQSPDFL
jgi:hypothetical protein